MNEKASLFDSCCSTVAVVGSCN